MIRMILIAFALSSVSAMASEYRCKQDNSGPMTAWLLFDDGPGGLDESSVTLNGAKLDEDDYAVKYGNDYGNPSVHVLVSVEGQKYKLSCTLAQ